MVIRAMGLGYGQPFTRIAQGITGTLEHMPVSELPGSGFLLSQLVLWKNVNEIALPRKQISPSHFKRGGGEL